MAKSSTTWHKGQSGNPKGPPKKKWRWSNLLRKAADEIDPKTKKPFRILVAKRAVVEAAAGNISAMREVFNRMEGFPKQPTDITSGGREIPILGSINVPGNDSPAQGPRPDAED